MTAGAPANASGRGGLSASASLSVSRRAGRQRIHWSHAWPVVLRPTGDDRVHLVHGAGGPLGGDVLALAVDVGVGAALAVRSAGATLVQPGPDGTPARWNTTVTVGAGGWLDWAPEPTIVVDGAVFDTRLRVDLAVGAGAVVREIVVLGRHGGRGGRYRGEVRVTLGGEVLLAHATVLDGADPALSGPAGTAGARAVGMALWAGPAVVAGGVDGVGAAGIADLGGAVDTVRPGGSGGSGGSHFPVVSGVPGIPGGAAGRMAGAGSAGGAGGADGSGERPEVRWAWSVLDGPGRILLAVGDPGPVTALLDTVTADLADRAIGGPCVTPGATVSPGQPVARP